MYVRGNLVYQDGEVVGRRGSGRFVERSFTAPSLEVGNMNPDELSEAA